VSRKRKTISIPPSRTHHNTTGPQASLQEASRRVKAESWMGRIYWCHAVTKKRKITSRSIINTGSSANKSPKNIPTVEVRSGALLSYKIISK